MSPALRLLEPALESLAQVAQPGRLIELSGHSEGDEANARTTTAVTLLRHAQREGETAVWIQPLEGPLYPPDLGESGIDLEALVVVHVPREGSGTTPPHRLCKTAETLLRSGAFGLVILDLCEGTPPPGNDAWQGRLLGLARQHNSRVVLLTDKPDHADSLGPLIGLRITARRFHDDAGFAIEYGVLKNKSGAPLAVAHEHVRGPWGL